ncbi:Flagellar basal-body rod protein FlgG [Helicobacter fennelliae]|uniref:Flagellar basal-body rod protein FlgG n=1 Tax=Helicobacter fennelliae TaxID=215 RepID=A0A2X3ERB1_9HELI|nr:Flagellar basal-body rod protein FlgG [Helicobacter fennelliae]
MINGYYSTTGGMITQFNRLDVISNNLANLNTNGFKRDDVVVGDFLRLYKQTQDTLLSKTTRALPHNTKTAILTACQIFLKNTQSLKQAR